MDFQIINLCEIIKNVIHPNEECHLQGEVDWSYLVQLSKDHNLLPIFVEGASKHLSYISRLEYEGEAKECMVAVVAQIRCTSAFLKLYKSFINAGLMPIVVKGLICRQLYGDFRDHRPSSDEDILVRACEYEKAKKVLIENGYVAEVEDVTKEQLERIQEISFTHPKDRLHIELHLNPMGRENDLRAKMSDYFVDVFEDYRDVEISGVMVRTLNHQDHLLFLILHAFRHFLAGGFGIRQMLDILLYYETYELEIDSQYLYNVLKTFHAETFWGDMIQLGNSYFGFHLSVMQTPNCPQELLEDMIRCGAFGNKTSADRTAERTISFATGNHLRNKKSNSISMIWRAIFPKRVFLLNISPYLEKRPWLLPVAWVQRWGRFLRRSCNNDGNLATQSMKLSQRRMKLLKKYDLV